jgi:glucose-1-phosphate thymidylyltransferase
MHNAFIMAKGEIPLKGLILCAGKGTRLYPITHSYPKTLLPVANIPILQSCIDKLAEQQIKEIGIVIHPSQESAIREHISAYEQWGLTLTLIYQSVPRGISDALRRASSFLGSDSFLLLLGDNLLTESLAALKELVEHDKCHAALLLAKVEQPQSYGIAEVSGERIVRLEEKPLNPKSDLAAMGAYAFAPTILRAAAAIVPSARGEYEITDAIQWLIDQGYPVAYRVTDKLTIDVGTPDRWLAANRWKLTEMKESEVVHESSVIENCRIIPPVAIGRDCLLKDCVIGPYVSIGNESTMEGCRIDNSIVLGGSHLRNIPYPIQNTIVGFDSVLAGIRAKQ